MGMRWQAVDLYFRQILASQLGIPMLGKIFFAFRAGDSNYKYEDFFNQDMDIPAELLFQGRTAVVDAYGAMEAGRNDVLIVTPGWYNMGVGLNWNKKNSHIVGLNNNNKGLYGTGNVVLYTTTTTTNAGYTLLISSDYNQIHNMAITSYGDNAACLSALKITGAGTFMKGGHIRGFGGATTVATANASDLTIGGGVAGAGAAARFEDVEIGSANTAIRTGTDTAVMLLGPTGNGTNPCGSSMRFINCVFCSNCATAGIPIIRLKANHVADRMMLFRDCTFFNHWAAMADNINYVVNDSDGSTHNLVFQNCGMVGVDAWSNNASFAFTTTANAASDGGKAIAVDTTP